MNLLLGCWLNNNSFAGDINPYNPVVPNEVKFANVTFQLNDVTKYLILNEMKDILSNRQVLLNKLEKATLFFPIVEPILRSQGVPDDFKFLVNYDKYQFSIEKNGTPESETFWCLDRQKAEEVDLLVNSQIDERKHLIVATKGAALCLKRNNILYNNWGATLYSLIAHKKIINQLEVNRRWVNSSNAENEYIALDSPAYIALLQFLAYKLIIEQEFPAFKPQIHKVVYEYPYSKGKSLNRISAELKVDLTVLKEFNPWLIAKNVPDTECQVLVVIPTSRFSEIRVLTELSAKSGVPSKDMGFPLLKKETKQSKNKGGVFYKINNLNGIRAEMCDNAVNLAYKAEIPLKKFVEYNDIKENDLLQIGQVYYLEEKRTKASVPFHIVRDGETLWSISYIYGVKLESLLKYNRFETVQRLQRGRVIWLQTTRPKNKPVEYINMPDELEAIDEIVRTESDAELNDNGKVFSKEPVKTDTIVLVDKSKVQVSKEAEVKNSRGELGLTFEEKELNSLPLTQEIRKEETKNLTLSKSVNTKDSLSTVLRKAETEVNTTPLIAQQITNPSKDKTTEQGNFLYHSVRKDETLFRISVNYNVSLEDLWKLNNLSSNIVKIGVVLKIKHL
ncbi:LysM peptidoglycan-binding domain-containing protein [Emticicia sp. BO119]|uniref:LysM peptidoglycan-binding domain-containing protein n=1 Tax=Emticicia sp. BO119 TaxID=2757768 RepID=UPI0015F0C329|nr:LysM peptidoglycan-binding domain-containing protein [Emticicia sp. BO119]MBA4850065.1 LysM peptidoglycan-binding domain-containing protein [Emticicia sp. BO119]